MRVISTKHFVFTFITHALNTLLLLFALYIFTYFQFFFLTLWSFYLNSFSLLATLICDINLYVRKSSSLERLYHFIHHRFFPISTSLSISVTVLFWLFTFLGPHFMRRATTFKEQILNIYLHGMQTLLVLIDMFISTNEQPKVFERKELRTISLIYLLYVIVCAVGKYVCGFNSYEFMKHASLQQLLIVSNVIYLFVFNSYQVYVWLINVKFKLLHRKKVSDDDTANDDVVVTK